MKSLNQYNKFKLLLILFVFVVGILCGKKVFNSFNKKIDDIDTSIVEYTVDNKVYGMPYINPAWEEYMKLSLEDKKQVSDVPSMYIYDYVPQENMFGDYNTLPSEFNLRDNYSTTLYDQGSEGLCWAYATATMLESNLKVTKGIDEMFSVHQLDYLTASTDYFVDNYNPYSFGRLLGDGMPYLFEHGYIGSILASGVSPVLNDKFNISYNSSSDQKLNISDIADSDNVDYSIVRTVDFPSYQNTDDYRNMLKSFIINYGAVRVLTVSPNYNGTNIIDYHFDDKYAFDGLKSYGHAMTIIGWDDDAGLDEDGDGKLDGAWILQNSWNAIDYNYYYITYSSDIFQLFGIIEMVDKNWDNSYDMGDFPNVNYKGLSIFQENSKLHMSVSESYGVRNNSLLNVKAISGTLYVSYNKPSFKEEKLNMINFSSASQNSTYKIYVSPDGDIDNFQYLKDVHTDMPGLYTVDVDDVFLNSDNFIIKIVTSDGAMYTQVNAFTSDVSINTIDDQISSYVDNGGFNPSGDYEYHIVSYVNGISDGESLKYFLHDESGNGLYDESEFNAIINNSKAVGVINLSRKTPLYSNVYVDVIYNDSVVETLQIIYQPFTYLGGMAGSGTEQDPYIITNAEQLSLITNSPSAYYVLGNDIDLSYDINNPVTFNKGFGWKPLSEFNGVLDGNNHFIRNMYIYSKEAELFQNVEKRVGLFSVLNGATVKNLSIVGADIVNDFDSYEEYSLGILSGKSESSQVFNVLVSGNVSDKSEIVSNNKGKIGMLIGHVVDSLNISQISCIGSIDSNYASYVGGVIGGADSNISVSNSNVVVNIGVSVSSSMYGGIVGMGDLTSIDNSYVFPFYSYSYLRKSKAYVDLLNGKYYSDVITDINNLVTFDSISLAYVDSSNFSERHSYDLSDNVKTFSSISDFSMMSLSQLGFSDDVWEYYGNNPYPTLKSLPFSYVTDIVTGDSFNVSVGSDRVIDVGIVPLDALYTDLSYSVLNDGIAYYNDGKIYGVSTGTTTLTISSNDGSNISKNVEIIVSDGEYNLSYKYSDDAVVSLKYDEGASVRLTDNDILNNSLRYLYGWKYNDVIYRTGDIFIMPDSDVVLEAVYRLEPPVLSTYEYSNDDNIIKNICYTSIDNYKNNLGLSSEYTVKVYNKNGEELIDGNIGTGYVTRIFKDSEEVIDYTNIVPGDLDGDGLIRSRDVTYALQYIVGIRQPGIKDYAHMALDFSRDGEIRLNDARLIQHYVVDDYSFFNEVCPNE